MIVGDSQVRERGHMLTDIIELLMARSIWSARRRAFPDARNRVFKTAGSGGPRASPVCAPADQAFPVPIGSLCSPLLDAPTPLAFDDKLKKLGERRTAATHRSFVAAIS